MTSPHINPVSCDFTSMSPEELTQLLTSAKHEDTLDATWSELTSAGTPIMNPQTGTGTFLFRLSALPTQTRKTLPPTPEISSVYLHVNRVTDKANSLLGRMQHIPDTDVWMCTIDISPTYRGSYGFRINAENRTHTPLHNTYDTIADPHAREQLAHDGPYGLSIVTGALAPDQPHWAPLLNSSQAPTAVESPTGKVIVETVRDHQERPLKVYLYLPPAAENSTCALLTIFDAETWFDRLGLPTVLDSFTHATAQAGAPSAPAVAVLGISCENIPQRMELLGTNHEFLDHASSILTSWALERAYELGYVIDLGLGNFLAGQSLGGISALYAARAFPDRFTAVYAQSPSLWWTPTERSTPAALSQPNHDWITTQFWPENLQHTTDAATQYPMIYIDVGTRENFTIARCHVLAMTLEHSHWPHSLSIYDGGHDYAWWRGALLDHLSTLRFC